MTELLSAGRAGIDRAARLLEEGALVAFPTETVYGLGADAASEAAVAAIFAAKGRPARNPLIAHVADIAAARRLVIWNDIAEQLATAFWPGPLTLVLPRAGDAPVAGRVTAGQAALAVRVPAHPVARDLLAAFGAALAAPSANPSGRVSPTSAAHVTAGLGRRIAAVIDGGDCAVGVESTVLDLCGVPAVLRAGGVTDEAVAHILGAPPAMAPDDDTPRSPGQLASHYAPAATLRLDAEAPVPGELWLGFGPDAVGAARNLSPTGDLAEAAANLFRDLRALDAAAAGGTIAVAPIPDRGLGRAINDRLARAAAPRAPV